MVHDRYTRRKDSSIITRRSQRDGRWKQGDDHEIDENVHSDNTPDNHSSPDQSHSSNLNGTSGVSTRHSRSLSGASNTDIRQTRHRRHYNGDGENGEEDHQQQRVDTKNELTRFNRATKTVRSSRPIRNGVYYGEDSDGDVQDEKENPRTKRSTRTEDNMAKGCDEEKGAGSRISTRRSLRSTPRVDADDGHSNHQEEEQDQGELLQRRSSRRRRFPYNPYGDAEILSPFKSRRQKNADSPPAAEDAGHEDDNTDNMDMYTRVKRARRKVKRDMYGMPLVEEEEKTTEDETENDEEEEEDEDDEEQEEEEEDGEEGATKQYNLRRNKPRTKLYVATIEKKTSQRYFKDTPPKRRYKERSEIKFKSPAHRRRKRKRTTLVTSSTSSSGSESEDERRFARRKNKSMAKARQRCLPMNLSQEDLSHTMKDRQKIGASLADIDPMSLDRSVTFESVGGLSEYLQALKEMIVFPLLYPEVFERFKIAPPRGVLFHGPPGTGKTLVARALANECSVGDKRVAFFMRKGADCLSKWVGESERQLRLLFDQAYQVRPSIIFFDEIDGLAPVRSSRQDQIHSSIVSTLLALMDGLDSRGEVIVIGATNRIDSIDPALRRPGRFDREFLFNLPPVEARAEILKIHTKEWNPKLLDRFVFEVASKCNGYCGADMKALCTEAALHALRRRYPQIYSSSDKLQLDVSSIDISAADFHYAMTKIIPAGQRAVITPSRPLSVIARPLLNQQLDVIVSQLNSAFPFITQAQSGASSLTGAMLDAVDDDPNLACVTECTKFKRKSKQGADAGPFLDFSIAAYSKPIVTRPRLLLYGEPAQGHSTHLAPALLHCLERIPVHMLDIPALYANSARTPEESCSQVFREARRSTPSVIYIPHIDKWWRVLTDTMQATFLMMLSDIDPLMPILLLATSDSSLGLLTSEIRELFAGHSSEQYEVRRPREVEIRAFFEDLLLRQTCVPPPTRKQAARNLLEVLPKVAVPSKPAQLTEAEEKALWNEEEALLRELRLFLRDMLNKLARDRKFNIFSKPVDDEEVPDYSEIIKTPMDLSTMMSKIDLHQYQSCEEFLDDIDLICANALEYNPADSIAGRAIRHRACALKDMAHALVDAELDEDFEKQCRDILESRRNRGKSPSKSAPKYYRTKPVSSVEPSSVEPSTRYSKRLKMEEVEAFTLADGGGQETRCTRRGTVYQTARVSHDITEDDMPTPAKKKRKKSSRWASGIISKKKYKRSTREEADEDSAEDEDQENKADSVDTPHMNGDISDREISQSEEIATSSNTIPSEELPVGDVSKAKVDLNAALDDCDSRETDSKDAVNIPQPSTQDSGCVDITAEEEPSNDADGPAISSNGSDPTPPSNGHDPTLTSTAMEGPLPGNQADLVEKNVSPDIIANMKDQPMVTDVDGQEIVTSQPETVLENKSVASPAENSDSDNAKEDHSDDQNDSGEHEPDDHAEISATSPAGSGDITASPVMKEMVVELEQLSPKAKRLTRSMTHDPHVIKCMEILEEPLPTFIIDSTALPPLLEKAVVTGLHCSVTELEKLYSLLAQKIYHHRESYDRTALLQELNITLDQFADRR